MDTVVIKKKNSLLVAYHYPPIRISSGLQRTLAFSQYLPECGWDVSVLTVKANAYIHTSNDQLKDIPRTVKVMRTFALDTSRHLSIKGKFFSFLAVPDHWSSWVFSGVFSGWRYILKNKTNVLFSTYPIATAHLIALILNKVTGIPWVADFRDPIPLDEPHLGWFKKRVFRWMDRKIIENCSKVTLTTHGAIKIYMQRYPHIEGSKFECIPNGYNEHIISEVEGSFQPEKNKETKPLTLVHSGLLYPKERDPRSFFQAIAELKEENRISAKDVNVILRASGNEKYFRAIVEKLNIGDIVNFSPNISYREALLEMMSVDGLLIFQGSDCNNQGPAKIYEYLRVQKPIFSMTDKSGDTALTLIEAGVDFIVPIDKPEEIKEKLFEFISAVSAGEAAIVSDDLVHRYSRESWSKKLVEIFDSI